MNHEYLDEGLLFADGQKTWSAEKVLKAQHAVGVSVVEVEERDGAWRVIMPSRHARRITARTPCRLSGPAAGHALVRTAADPGGRLVLGTYSGCAHGWTPWGTYLTCEENWQFQFVNRGAIPADQRRYRITATGRRYRWEEFDERFDAGAHPNEPNRFGWVVEIDPHDPQAAPVKRTALGRMAHEGAACSVGPDGRLAFYMADDWEFEYVYKFVTARALRSRPPRGQSRPPRRGHALRRALQCRRQRRLAAPRARPGAAHRRQWLRRSGRGPREDAPGRGCRSARPRWIGRSGSCRTR